MTPSHNGYYNAAEQSARQPQTNGVAPNERTWVPYLLGPGREHRHLLKLQEFRHEILDMREFHREYQVRIERLRDELRPINDHAEALEAEQPQIMNVSSFLPHLYTALLIRGQ